MWTSCLEYSSLVDSTVNCYFIQFTNNDQSVSVDHVEKKWIWEHRLSVDYTEGLLRSVATISETEKSALSPTITRELWFASLIDGIEMLDLITLYGHHQLGQNHVAITMFNHPWDYLSALFLLTHNLLLLSPIFKQLPLLQRWTIQFPVGLVLLEHVAVTINLL